MDALLKYSWPGNVRELENAVERAAILCLGEYISERELPMAVSSAPKNSDAPTLAELQGAAGEEPISMTLDEMERAAILPDASRYGGQQERGRPSARDHAGDAAQ